MLNKNLSRKILTSALALSFSISCFIPNAYAEEKTTSIQIVHTNDIHGYYAKSDNGNLGFAVLKGIIDSEEADLVLDIGDCFHGQSFATIEQGKSISELMNAVGYDAVTPGNHDWSYGSEQLKALEEENGFKILASNVVNNDGTKFFDSDYIIKDITADDGTELKVGVIGVIDDAFYSSTSSKNVEGLQFEEEAAEASEKAAYLKENENCDIILAITHQSNCEEFVSKINNIDAVLAGHEHLVFNKSYPDSEGKMIPVVEAGYYFYNIGVLDLTLDPKTKEIISADETVYSTDTISDITENSDILNKIQEIENRQQIILGEIIGYTSETYPYSWEDVRVSQQKIGSFITQSYIAETGADIAFENGGGIRSGIESGDITYNDIISISPYGNGLVTKKLTGKQIIEVLNESNKIGKNSNEIYNLQKEAVIKGNDPYEYQWPDNCGSYIQYGGIEIETDENGSIISAKINSAPIDENKLYTVATNSFLAESQDYPALS